ncbi:glutamine amidotransferase [Alkalilimnicola ehrlichii]|uniref:Glutamine amidotransferase n=1 Tax=Alkalilimnicola ehrlichii TaxID=351052 RepID=A0A3E0WQX7_9GAMM|nr:glutamine amidotransferase [Alkalilimnicola ehrlichii]RFA27197.1 glutamine amidotransferase [Alkalilimnicola ehrlichii]RFA35370.1 glutamine amidotransferase [Alkalilimnicola ehrlichii]
MEKTALAIRHLAFEGLGSFGPVLQRRGYRVEYREAGETDFAAIDPAAADLLVVLGGPIAAYDTDKYPLLRDEQALLAERLRRRLPTLGICLGAQIMAQALGARVYPGPEKEIGFGRLRYTPEGRQGVFAPLAEADVPVLHWHGDTFDLPEAASLLASTDVCPNQAFAIENYALALQFHPEATAAGFEHWLIGHCCEIGSAGLDPVQLRADGMRYLSALEEVGPQVLERWLDKVD